jgi:pimeloyl-ACP methyl ester carboxylesterase
MRAPLLQIFAVIVVAGSLQACGSGSSAGGFGGTAAAAGDLVASQSVGTLTAAQLTTVLESSGITGVLLSYNAHCYKLTYKTPDVSGTLINASGLTCLPNKGPGAASPVVSYQHGTIFQDRDAPSSFLTSGDAFLGAAFAALGYIAVLPDYVGYGASTGTLHPYVHAATLASATVDMNRAARSFLALPAINVARNGQLFLAGYSEGGYATLATQRLMEQSLATEFPVTASEPGAGPYDVTHTVQAILAAPAQAQPAFTGFFIKAYDSIYNASSQLGYYFSASYATIVDTYFDGNYSGSEISAALGGPGVATNTLFNPVFITSYLGVGETALKSHVSENDIYNWAPAVPTHLFHGVDDEVVAYSNAVTAKAAMDIMGSTSVTVVTCYAGGSPTTHGNCALPYFLDMIVFFNNIATGL